MADDIGAALAWQHDAEQRYRVELSRLLDVVPALAEVAVDDPRRGGWPVTLHCPHGHRLITVQAIHDHDRVIRLAHAERVDPRRVGVAEPTLRSDPQPAAVLAASVRLPCVAPRCHYQGTHRHETLLRCYASALALGRHEAHLTA